MVKLIADNRGRRLLVAVVLAEDRVRNGHQGVILVAHVKRHGKHEVLRVQIVLFDRTFVPRLVYRPVVDVVKISGGKHLVCESQNFSNGSSTYGSWTDGSMFCGKYCQRVSPLCVAKKATVIPKRFMNSVLDDNQLIVINAQFYGCYGF